MKRTNTLFLSALMVACTAMISACSPKASEGSTPDSKAQATSAKGYTLQPREVAIVEFLIKDEVAHFSKGDESLIGEGMVSVATLDVTKAYNENQVAADQKYFKKLLHLTGLIESINSGLGNEPYLALQGGNPFMAPQVHFQKANIEKISALRKGQKVVMVCTGGGSIAGTPMFKNCVFADDYAAQEATKLKLGVSEFLLGKQPVSENVLKLTLGAITLARSLPEKSTCFGDGRNCAKDMGALTKDTSFKDKFTAVSSELKAAGVQVAQQP